MHARQPGAENRLDADAMDASNPLTRGAKTGKGGKYSSHKRWLQVLSLLAFLVACVLLTLHVFHTFVLSERAAHAAAGTGPAGVAELKTLSFSVCHGMPNQRLALLYGVLMAVELGRVPVLPDLLSSGSGQASVGVDGQHTLTLYDVTVGNEQALGA